MALKDLATIGSVIQAGYEVLSGPAGPRDWDRFRTLHVERSRFSIIDSAETGVSTLRHYDIDGYIERVGPLLMEQDFYEIEVARREERYGRIAHAFSTYASFRDPSGEPFMQGINSIQLQRFSDGWRIVSVYWDRQPIESLPEKHLVSVEA